MRKPLDILHAPPWHFDGHGVNATDGTRLAKLSSSPYTSWALNAERSRQHDATGVVLAAAPAMLDALYSILNAEAPAAAAQRSLPAFKEFDTAFHFDKVRAAIAAAEREI